MVSRAKSPRQLADQQGVFLESPSERLLQLDWREKHAITLDQLRIFISVAEREHMTQAAEILNVAQSAVSTAVAKLEGELEMRLFERTGRNVRLTAAGHAFCNQARKLLDHADELRRWVGDYKRDIPQQKPRSEAIQRLVG